MTIQRFQAECAALAAHFPVNRFGFVWGRNPRLEVILPIATKDEYFGSYKVKIYRLNLFPETQPIVTPGTMLKDIDGEEMAETSYRNHLWDEYNGESRLCLYSEWDPQYSLNKTAFRAAMWLLAYHMHLKTGRSIDSYLSHKV